MMTAALDPRRMEGCGPGGDRREAVARRLWRRAQWPPIVEDNLPTAGGCPLWDRARPRYVIHWVRLGPS